MAPTEWVRVRDERTGHQYTTPAKKAAADSELTVLKGEHAVDINGRILAPVYADPAPKATPAATKKES